jgi:hypothetical protein
MAAWVDGDVRKGDLHFAAFPSMKHEDGATWLVDSYADIYPGSNTLLKNFAQSIQMFLAEESRFLGGDRSAVLNLIFGLSVSHPRGSIPDSMIRISPRIKVIGRSRGGFGLQSSVKIHRDDHLKCLVVSSQINGSCSERPLQSGTRYFKSSVNSRIHGRTS